MNILINLLRQFNCSLKVNVNLVFRLQFAFCFKFAQILFQFLMYEYATESTKHNSS